MCVYICIYIYVCIYMYIYIYVKESKRMHRFSVTLSFAPKCSSDSMYIYNIYIYRSLTETFLLNFLSFLCQKLSILAFF